MEPQTHVKEVDQSEFYPMPQGEPHGLCVIINVDNFMEPQNNDDNVSIDSSAGLRELENFKYVQ